MPTPALPYLQILKEFVAAYGPLVILLEDLHHFDTLSWGFLVSVAQLLDDRLVVVATMRPNDGSLALATKTQPGKEMLYAKAQESLAAIQVGFPTCKLLLCCCSGR